MNKGFKISVLVIIIIMFLSILGCQKAQPPKDYLQESKADFDARMQWWKEARFGMFIHWGLYAIPAGTYNGEQIGGLGEWIQNSASIPAQEYEKYAPQFNPIKYDANEWVRMAKEAGMKYIVITSKHHDGFCLWDSKLTEWDVMDATPFKRDILKELKQACDAQDIKLCFYHSIMDWHHPDAQAPFYPEFNNTKKTNPNFPKYVENYMKPQLKELVDNYGKLGIMWFDGEWIGDYTSPMGKDVYNYVRNLQPDIIVNNRVDKGRQGMKGQNKEGDFAGDYGTPEQEIPDTGLPGVEWESCMTMNDTWGFKSFDHNWKSTEILVRNLIDIASKGGNYLLNIGPKADGTFPEASIQRLAEIGEWMNVYGESIYGTMASPVEKPEWGRYTQKEGKLYAHVFEWPKSRKLVVPVKSNVSKVYELSTPETALNFKVSGDECVINLPRKAFNKIASVIVVEY